MLQRIWQQMHEPKWCISMGACASTAECSTLRRRAGDRPLYPGRYVRFRLPPAAEQLIQAIIHLQDKIQARAPSTATSSTGRAATSKAGLDRELPVPPSLPHLFTDSPCQRRSREGPHDPVCYSATTICNAAFPKLLPTASFGTTSQSGRGVAEIVRRGRWSSLKNSAASTCWSNATCVDY